MNQRQHASVAVTREDTEKGVWASGNTGNGNKRTSGHLENGGFVTMPKPDEVKDKVVTDDTTSTGTPSRRRGKVGIPEWECYR